jgi:hypothetical protein
MKAKSDTMLLEPEDQTKNIPAPAPKKTLSLPEVARELRRLTGQRVTYQGIYRRMIDGDLPGIRKTSGRWIVLRADLPTIARILGLIEE